MEHTRPHDLREGGDTFRFTVRRARREAAAGEVLTVGRRRDVWPPCRRGVSKGHQRAVGDSRWPAKALAMALAVALAQ
eukprot:7325052-Prymnesium_polylepis.1